MEQWEYKVDAVKTASTAGEEQSALNKLGKDGWELVSVLVWRDAYTMYYMKRRIVDTAAYRG